MKKKKWLIPIAVVAIILILLVVFIAVIESKGMSISVGRYLEAKDGSAILVCRNSPIRMNAEENIFAGLDTGDSILVIHGLVLESYPGQTWVSSVFKLADGSIKDISSDVVDKLVDLGWLETD